MGSLLQIRVGQSLSHFLTVKKSVWGYYNPIFRLSQLCFFCSNGISSFLTGTISFFDTARKNNFLSTVTIFRLAGFSDEQYSNKVRNNCMYGGVILVFQTILIAEVAQFKAESDVRQVLVGFIGTTPRTTLGMSISITKVLTSWVQA